MYTLLSRENLRGHFNIFYPYLFMAIGFFEHISMSLDILGSIRVSMYTCAGYRKGYPISHQRHCRTKRVLI